MSVAELQPDGCPFPVDEAGTVKIFPRCLGGLLSVDCQVCPVVGSDDTVRQPDEVLRASEDQWIAIDTSRDRVEIFKPPKRSRGLLIGTEIHYEQPSRIVAAGEKLGDVMNRLTEVSDGTFSMEYHTKPDGSIHIL